MITKCIGTTWSATTHTHATHLELSCQVNETEHQLSVTGLFLRRFYLLYTSFKEDTSIATDRRLMYIPKVVFDSI